jgi:hypothetical protein
VRTVDGCICNGRGVDVRTVQCGLLVAVYAAVVVLTLGLFSADCWWLYMQRLWC